MDEMIVKAGKLIDGRGGPVLQNMAVTVRGGAIVSVEPWDRVRLPESGGPMVLDFPDATLLPGLIDCHTHTNMPANGRTGEEVIPDGDDLRLLRSARNARIALHSGVTTMCDNGAWNHTGFALKEGILQGEVEGPRLLACGRPVTITGGHCWFMGSEADGVDGVAQATRQLVKEGADFIKVMATGGSTLTSNPYLPAFSVDELRSIVREGKNHNRVVAAHCRCNEGMRNAVEAGLDGIFHAFFAAEDGSPAFDADLARRIADKGIWVNPTIQIGRSGLWAMEWKRREEGLTLEEEDLLSQRRESHKIRLDQCSQMLDLGVKMVAGSDCGWGNYPFGQLAYELECMIMAGMTPMKAISSATRDAAFAMGVEDLVGVVEPGKRADLLVVEGDPSENVLELTRVVAVFKDGFKVAL